MNRHLVFSAALALSAHAFVARADVPPDDDATQVAPEKPPFDWVMGPGSGGLGSFAELSVPEGYRFTDAKGTRMLMEAMGNPVSGDELGFVAPEDGDWFVVFEFDDIGYVKDDEKDELDADDILESLKRGNDAANEMRKQRGWPLLEIVGWETPPKYNEQTHNLEWAVRAKSQADANGEGGGFVVNHNTRILGRHGVMRVSLVIDPEQLQGTLPTYRTLMNGYSYKDGEKYAQFTSGDKMAEYGLVALVAGGAGAVAAKTGLLAKLGKGVWKLLILAGAAVAGVFKKVFGGNKNA